MGVRAGTTTSATLSGPSLASWFLERKVDEGYKDTLDQSDWCLMFLCSQAWISLLCLPEPRANKKTVLKVFQGGLFHGFKGSLCQLVHQKKAPGGDAPSALGSVSVEAIQETGKILIFTDINEEVTQLVSNG